MKTYLRSQIPYVAIVAGAIAILLFIILLDGYQNFVLIGYALFLVVVLVTSYLTIAYYRNRTFFHYVDRGISVGNTTGYLSKRWRKRFEQEYEKQESKRQAREKVYQNHIKFMNIWVHQMKTPVSVLALMAERDQVDTMDLLIETERLKNGLTTALTYTRLEEFTEDFVIEATSLRVIMQHAISKQKRNFIRSEIYPKIVNQQDTIIRTDRKWLSILLDQLISNSIKYSQAGATVWFTIDEQTQTLRIEDSGCGIPKGDVPRVFRPFFTGENGRRYGESTGMGLYLVDVIAKRLAVDVRLTSRINKGTVIELTFTTREG